MRFEWDAAKDRGNQKKHGLSFLDASLLFSSGQDYLEIFHSAHSDTEDRFIAIGQIDRGIAVVIYTERDDELIRIIGARFATKREQELHRQQMDQHR